MTISRREFAKVSASALLAMATIDVWSQTIRRRKEIRLLSATELTSYRAGVDAMKALARTNPFSWEYQRAVHGIPAAGTPSNPSADPADAPTYWRKCHHGTEFFFPWHRWELLYWEEICRQLCGDTKFTLPYWDYFANGFLPDALRAAPGGASNALHHARRNTGINDGSTQLNTGPGGSIVLAGFGETVYSPFRSQFEGNPHGAVHVAIGGDMGSVPTAALDPVFWLHHANIDRYWVEWLRQGGGRANPSGTWPGTAFQFQSTSGPKTPNAGQAETTEGLGYTYDKPPKPDWRRDILKWLKMLRYKPRFFERKPLPIPWPPKPRPGPDPIPWLTIAAIAGLDFTGYPSVVQIALDRDRIRDVQGALLDRKAEFALTLYGIKVNAKAAEAGFQFEIVAIPSLSEFAAQKLRTGAFVGDVNSFAVSAAMTHHHEHKDSSPLSLVVPLSSEARALLAKAISQDPALIFARRHPLADSKGRELDFEPDEVMFSAEQIRLEVRPYRK